MTDRRTEARMLCAELVKVCWRNNSGHMQTEMMNLEEISLSGACLQGETPVGRGTNLTIRYGNGTLSGAVRYCRHQELGYFLGVEFADGCKWPTDQFRPKHLLDPRKLVGRAMRRDADGPIAKQ